MVPNLGAVARLIGDPVRSKMLFALLGGGECSATELAMRSESSAQSASMHLSKLVAGGLLSVRSEGRHRFFRLTSTEIARALEVLSTIAPVPGINSLSSHNAMQRLPEARTCYDHLAGRLGVAVSESLLKRGAIRLRGDEYAVTPRGTTVFDALGVDVQRARSLRRAFARPCLDWTERRHHVAGALGSAILDAFLHEKWVQRNSRDRSLAITDAGWVAVAREFGFGRLSHASTGSA